MTNRNRVRLSKLSLGLAIALAAAPAFAQNTTSALGGRITSTGNTAVAGAEVTIVHTPSGTISKATTDADGRYVARGLRVGGPYTITITKDGKTQTREGVYLQLAETGTVDASLAADATQIAAVKVTGANNSIFDPNSMGATTSISREQIAAFASIQRNLQDYARIDPRVAQTDKERGEMSIAGQNIRANTITIDGVNTSDTFGLEPNSLPTAKQPISIDAIDAVQVNISNYDVTQTGYTGGNINAVTKSGTNEFHGSVYNVFRNSAYTGKNYNLAKNSYSKVNPYLERTWGMTFGGPIVKDKLFFFASYEDFTNTRGYDNCLLGDNCGTIVGITQADINSIQAIANTKSPAMNIGTLANATPSTVKDELVKLDWNINDSNRLSFRYNKTKETTTNYRDFGARAISLDSHWDVQNKVFENYTTQWFSDWTDSFSTEAKLSYRSYDSTFVPGSNLPEVTVQFTAALPPGSVVSSTGNRTLLFGTERSRQTNVLWTKTWNGYFAANWYLGDHQVKFGIDEQRNEIFNYFVQASKGRYFFTTPATFASNTPSSYTLTVPAPGYVATDAAVDFKLNNHGLFVQDSWAFNSNLTLLLGVRADSLGVGGTPIRNIAVNQPTVAAVGPLKSARQTGGFGYDNTSVPSNTWLFEPRVGFNYTFDSDRPTQLRGGFGLFQGQAANVYLSNAFTNNGMTTRIIGCGTDSSLGTAFAACAPGTFSSDPNNQPVFNPVGTPPKSNVDLIDPNFKQPTSWKFNLAFEHELPFFGLDFTAEYIRVQTKDGILYKHLNLGAPTRIGPDGRPMYWGGTGTNAYDPSCFVDTSGFTTTAGAACAGLTARAKSNALYNNVMLLTNTNKGDSNVLTVGVSRPMKDAWSWSLAYTYTDATEVSPTTSSTSNSTWNSRQVFDPNEDVASTSNYEIRNRFNGTASWQHSFFGDYKTELGLFYEGRNGKPYSWVYSNDMNGDAQNSDLVYIPRGIGSGEVVFQYGTSTGFTSNVGANNPAAEAAFWNIINANGLSRYAGQVIPRNSSRNPWVNQFDFRVKQEFPGFFSGNKAVVTLDILNVGNLLNKKWGHIDEIGFPSNRNLVQFDGMDSSGRYVYRVINDTNGAPTTEQLLTRNVRSESQWNAQLTVRYEF